MKVQDLAIIFIIIILPISLVLATYTQYQIQTINRQTLYDAKLTSATYDAIRAFQINTMNNKESDLSNSKIRDLEASVSTFRNSIMSTFSLHGYTEEDLNSYIPALVYTLYDGFYIYSPYTNINYRYEPQKDVNGNIEYDAKGNIIYTDILADGNGEDVYGLKPYISYSCRYKSGNNDVVITYALDNHITVQGWVDGEFVSKDGYLIDNIKYDEANDKVVYNGIEIKKEHTKKYLPLNDDISAFSYMTLDGVTYYLYGDEEEGIIIARLNENSLTVQYEYYIDDNGFVHGNKEEYQRIYNLITEGNTLSKDYYKDASEFTEWFKGTSLVNLKYGDAYDKIIDDEGNVIDEQLWKDDNTRIFQFNTSLDYSKNIENALSSFNQHRLGIIRHKIEVNLAIAIANYNNYFGASNSNVFQMPELKEDEWDSIIHNISLISFLQGLPIGGKLYNGYSIVTNSESEEVVLEENIYILGQNQHTGKSEYYKVGDQGIRDGNVIINSGDYADNTEIYRSAGRFNLDFKRDRLINSENEQFYYYSLKDYNASYNSVVMQNKMDTYDDIYKYVNSQSNELKVAFYTALGRERASRYKKWTDYSDVDIHNSSGDKLNAFRVEYYDSDNILLASKSYAIYNGESVQIEIRNVIPKKEGAIDSWWGDAYGRRYEPGQIIRITEGLTLVAKYELASYTVTFDANTGNFPGGGTESTRSVLHGSEISLTPSGRNPVKTGYSLVGWSETPDGPIAEEPYTITGDKTFYAIWEPNEFKIIYNANGGTGAPSARIKKYGETLVISQKIPVRQYYIFLGWSTDPLATVPQYKGGDMYSKDADLTLYAVWELATYTITYDANGGTGDDVGSDTEVIGKNVTLKGRTVFKAPSGKHFGSWNTKPDGTGTSYSAGGSYAFTEDTKLYAIWNNHGSSCYEQATCSGRMTEWLSDKETVPGHHDCREGYIENCNVWNVRGKGACGSYHYGEAHHCDCCGYVWWPKYNHTYPTNTLKCDGTK